MIQLTLNGTEFLFVNCDKEFSDPELGGGNGLFLYHDTKPIGTATRVQLPPGSWSILFTLKEAMEDETKAAQVVEQINGATDEYKFKSYHYENVGHVYASTSLRSLISKHSIPINSLVLKRFENGRAN